MKRNLPIIRRSATMTPAATRRPGIRERRLLTADEREEQNVVLIDADAGAEVEEHEVLNSESFFVLAGRLKVFGPGFTETLAAGDLCAFPARAAHGVSVLQDARFLVVFAPAGRRPSPGGGAT